ncbi:MAG: protein kinase [Acidimicrobiaceae bacterium]|nr:protein kinase [Acidimicrobiaceae bacterium]
MALEDRDRDASVVVDEALLASLRGGAPPGPGESAAGADAPAGDGGSATGQDASETVEDRGAGTGAAGGAAREIPTIEGYGALREIGRGGFSTVFEALQFEFERWVAVKVLDEAITDDEAVADFERECRAMGGLSSHPNIVTVFSSEFTSDRRPCIVMELFPHGNYLNILQRTGPLGLEQLLPVSVRVAGALATAHNRGMVHGDVKPQNIFRSQYEVAALGDFGIATLISHRWSDQKTRMSLYYAAPEIIERGVAAASPFADQYSLAATIYTLATGLRPFEGDGSETTRQVLERTLTGPPPKLGPEHPAAMRDLLHKAMSRRLSERFRDVREFAEALVDMERQIGLSPTEIRIGADAGRYIGGVVDLSGSMSRSQESSREPSSDRSIPAAPRVAGGQRPGGDPSGGVPSQVERPVHSRDTSSTGGLVHGAPDADYVAVDATIVRPQRPVAPAQPSAGPEQPQEKSKIPRWAKIGSAAVAVAAAGAAIVLVLTLGGDDGAAGGDDGAADDEEMRGDDEQDSPPTDTASSTTTSTTTTTIVGPVVPDAPIELVVQGRDERLVVSWQEPNDGGSPISHYEVGLHLDGVEQSIDSRTINDLDDLHVEFTGLVNGQTYEVRVAAVNEAKLRGDDDTKSATPRAPPDRPRNVVVDEAYRQLEVKWDAPDDGGSAITEYRVELYSDGEMHDDAKAVPESLTAEFSDLDSGRSYEVRLFAQNEAGLSEAAVQYGIALDRIAFVSNLEGQDAIYYVDVRRRNDSFSLVEYERVTDSDTREREGRPSWSPDGEWIAFQRRHPEDTHWQIFLKNIESDEELRLLCGRENGWAPTWSPDGRSIAFARGSAGNDIWVIDSVSGEATRLKDKFDADDAFPSWSPDGDTIAVARRDHDPTRSKAFNDRQPREIRVFTGIASGATGGELGVGRLTDYRTGDYSSPDWSPEGDRIAHSVKLTGSGHRHIEVIDRDGNLLQPLTLEDNDDHPSWSPDGEWIVFERDTNGSRDLYVVSSAGGEPIPVLEHRVFDYWSPSWAPGSDVTVAPAFDCGS